MKYLNLISLTSLFALPQLAFADKWNPNQYHYVSPENRPFVIQDNSTTYLRPVYSGSAKNAQPYSSDSDSSNSGSDSEDSYRDPDQGEVHLHRVMGEQPKAKGAQQGK